MEIKHRRYLLAILINWFSSVPFGLYPEGCLAVGKMPKINIAQIGTSTMLNAKYHFNRH